MQMREWIEVIERGERHTLAEAVMEVTPVDTLRALQAPPLAAIKVYRNPTRAEFGAVAPTMAEKNHALRFLIEITTGDLYVWDGMAATHSAIFNGLYLPGDLYTDSYFGHIRPGKGALPMVELDTANFDPEVLRSNANIRHILGSRFRVVEID